MSYTTRKSGLHAAIEYRRVHHKHSWYYRGDNPYERVPSSYSPAVGKVMFDPLMTNVRVFHTNVPLSPTYQHMSVLQSKLDQLAYYDQTTIGPVGVTFKLRAIHSKWYGSAVFIYAEHAHRHPVSFGFDRMDRQILDIIEHRLESDDRDGPMISLAWWQLLTRRPWAWWRKTPEFV